VLIISLFRNLIPSAYKLETWSLFISVWLFWNNTGWDSLSIVQWSIVQLVSIIARRWTHRSVSSYSPGHLFRKCPFSSSYPGWLWRVSSSRMWRRVVRRVSTDVSEEHIASICLLAGFAELISSTLKMEELCSSETSLLHNGLHGVISQKKILFNTIAVKTSNPTRCCPFVCLCIPLTLLGNGSVETLSRYRIHTQQKKNCWTRRFQCGPCRIKKSRRLVLPRTSCLNNNSKLSGGHLTFRSSY
jgi:hypothetical protein